MSAFIDSILLARKEAADDASALRECASRLQQHNRELKQHICQVRRAVPVPPARPTPGGAESLFSLRAER